MSIDRSLSRVIDERDYLLRCPYGSYNQAIVFVIRKHIVDWITGASNLSKNLVKRNASRLNWFQGYKNALYAHEQVHLRAKAESILVSAINSFIYRR